MNHTRRKLIEKILMTDSNIKIKTISNEIMNNYNTIKLTGKVTCDKNPIGSSEYQDNLFNKSLQSTLQFVNFKLN